MRPHNSVFVLGAGFSAPAGLPIGKRLFSELTACAASRSQYDREVLSDHLDEYQTYKKRVHGVETSEQEVDIEDFIAFFDLRQKLQLRGGGIRPDRGTAFELDPFQYWIRYMIGLTLHLAQRRIDSADRELYVQFAKRLRPGDVIITFNYDTLLETALDQAGKTYRHYLYSQTGEGWEESAAAATDVIILKMHGSIDWFDRSNFEYCNQPEQSIYPGAVCPLHPIFQNGAFQPTPLVNVERFESDPLHRLYRISNLEDYYVEDNEPISHDVPLIVSPSHYKLLYMNPLMEFWRGLINTGILKTRKVVIGYSLPSYDEYARMALSHLTSVSPLSEIMGLGKLKFVDYRQTPDEIEDLKRSFSFVDWDTTECYFNGFNMDAIKMTFDE